VSITVVCVHVLLGGAGSSPLFFQHVLFNKLNPALPKALLMHSYLCQIRWDKNLFEDKEAYGSFVT